jgi:hypothetical protein
MNEQPIHYEDERFAAVEAQQQKALEQVDATYGQLAEGVTEAFDAQKAAVEGWQQTQTDLQTQQGQLSQQQLQQQKDAAAESYEQEQSAAYTDYQKATARHGVEAEKLAGGGLTGSGYSESSLTRLYTAYQNRVATARAAYEAAVLGYDTAMAEARLQNSAQLAQIAYDALQTQLSLSMESLQYQNDLLQQQAAARRQVEDTYYQRSQDVLAQINRENALAEEIRQFNLRLQEEIRQFEAKNQPKVRYVYLQPPKEETPKAPATGGSGGTGGGVIGTDIKTQTHMLK